MPTYTYKRAALHAGLAFLLLVVFAGVISAIGGVADPYRFGNGVGRLSFFVSLATFALSYFVFQRRGPWVMRSALGLYVLALAVGGYLLLSLDRAEPLTVAESAALEVKSDGKSTVLRHESLEVTLTLPGPTFAPKSEMADQFKAFAAECFSDPDTNTVCMLRHKGDGLDEASLQRMVRDLNEGFTASAKEAGVEVQVMEERYSWSVREARYHATVGPAHVRVRAWSRPAFGAILVFAIGTDDWTDAVAAGFEHG